MSSTKNKKLADKISKKLAQANEGIRATDASHASAKVWLSMGRPNILAIAYSRLSLQGKISVPFISVFLLMWILVTLSVGYYFSQDLKQRQLAETRAIASLVLREFEQEQKELRLNATLLAENEVVSRAVAEGNTKRLLRNLSPFKSVFSFDLIKVVDNNNTILTELRQRELFQLNMQDNLVISQVLNSVKLSSLIATQPREQTGMTRSTPSVLVGTAPIKNDRQTIGGMVVGRAISDRLLHQISEGIEGKYIAAFNQGKAIASTLPSADFAEWKTPPSEGISYLKIAGNSYLSNTAILSGLEDATLKLVVLSPLAPLARSQQRLWLTIAGFSAVGIIVATAVGYWVAYTIARRVTMLMEATQKFASGNLKTRLVMTSRDEVGQLARRFNYMAEQLEEREQKINLQMEKLENTLQQLASTQAQMVHEKMSSLGQMVAGIAHEINNPISFIYGNIDPAGEYLQDIRDIIELYQQYYPEPVPEIATRLEEVELDYSLKDFENILRAMKQGADRIKAIVLEMRNFSRLDEAESKAVDLHEGIDSTLTIVRHRLRSGEDRPEIQVIKNYGKLPLVECYAGQLNQVFLHIINNAIDVLREASGDRHPTISIATVVCPDGQRVAISITDNGRGMNEQVLAKIFDPFFTTKPVGRGTGLGLAVSYQIVVKKHGGNLKCFSQLGRGTEFLIEIPIRLDAARSNRPIPLV